MLQAVPLVPRPGIFSEAPLRVCSDLERTTTSLSDSGSEELADSERVWEGSERDRALSDLPFLLNLFYGK